MVAYYNFKEVNKLNLFDFIKKRYPFLKEQEYLRRTTPNNNEFRHFKGSKDGKEYYIVAVKNIKNEYYYFNKNIQNATSSNIINLVGLIDNLQPIQAAELIISYGFKIPILNEIPTKTKNDLEYKPNEFYYEINLKDFLLSIDPEWKEDTVKGTRRFPIIRKYDKNGKCIAKWTIAYYAKDNRYLAFDTYNMGTAKNIFNIVQDLNGGPQVFNIGRAKKFIDEWLNNRPLLAQVKILEKPKVEKFELNKHWKPEINYRYFKFRGISGSILKNPKFKDIIGTEPKQFFKDKNINLKNVVGGQSVFQGGANILNTSYKLRDENGNTVGVIIKNKHLDDRTFSKCIGEKKKGLVYNDFEHNKETKVVLGESFEDVISYYLLHKNKFIGKQPLLIATGGEFSHSQLIVMTNLLKKVKSFKLTLASDNDLFGAFFASKVLGLIEPPNINHSQFSSSYPFHAQMVDNKTKGRIKFETIYTKENSIKDIIDVISRNKKLKTEISSVMKKGKEMNIFELQIKFDNTPLNWQEWFNVAMDIRYNGAMKTFLSIDYPIEKDFNQDLQTILGITHLKEQTKLFRESQKDLLGADKLPWMNGVGIKVLYNYQDLFIKAINEGRLTSQNLVEIFTTNGLKLPKWLIEQRNEDLYVKSFDKQNFKLKKYYLNQDKIKKAAQKIRNENLKNNNGLSL